MNNDEDNDESTSNCDHTATRNISDIPCGLEKIVHIQTEDNILREVSEHIKSVRSSNNQSAEKIQEDNTILCIKENEEINNENRKKAELRKQVEIGEITPFEAVSKQSTLEQRTGNKDSQLLDLEKYFKQQAALAQQKRKFKKVPEISGEKSHLKPTGSKLSSNGKKTNKKSHKSKQNGNNHSQQITTNVASSTNFSNELYDNNSDTEYIPSDNEVNSDVELDVEYKPSPKKKRISASSGYTHTKKTQDDGDIHTFQQRIETNNYPKDEALHNIDKLFKVPQSIWERLYRFQKVSVKWLWELHSRRLGGLLGDEMGLGKTVQIIAFLAGLDCSELLSYHGRFRGLGPTIIVCPATLMEQWVKHFHEWWPFLRIVILHHSGGYNGDPASLIESLQTGGVLVASYNGILKHENLLASSQWHYVILDEGHKIRNPQAKISRAVKRFQTPHRLLLTGSPMQNSLKELWSLFDFILPGKLGTLPVFLEHCAAPIMRGGYANATSLQEATALQVATMLKDTITPYMLRRTKVDVRHHLTLPEKNEQVLFCSLTDEQKKLYKKYLRSEDVSFILHEKDNYHESKRYRARFLIALSALRKICNHPDLFLYTRQLDSDEDISLTEESSENFGYWKRAGKMTVVRSLLKIWQKQKHRVLLFTQGRQMMHILESLLQREGYTYLRLDGTTAMSQRQQTIHKFNNDLSYFAFLLTTRVGGLGVNLTGANRVIIYDPDWNPATDAQARARAWRIGQDKQVTIYRLITAGTIEEKIYHRQIFKLLLSNKVLDEPHQRRLFKTSDLVELFNFNEPIDGEFSESDRLFRESKLTMPSTSFSLSKIEKMKKLASTLSNKISESNAAAKSTRDSSKQKHDEQNINSSGTIITKEPPSENQTSSQQQISTQISSNEQNENLNSHADNKGDNGIKNNNMSTKDNPEQDIPQTISTDATDDNSVEKESDLILRDDEKNKQTLPMRKRKKNKKSVCLRKEEVSALFEGERVSCLIGRRIGYSNEKEKSVSTMDDEYVLRKLFSKSTVSSAFQHEAVLSNARNSTENENTMQRFARESAHESMDIVRQSGRLCWRPA